MGNLRAIPFTELFERVQKEARDVVTNAATEAEYKGRVNDVYLRDLPSRYKWWFLRTNASVTINADYKTGTATVTSGSKVLTGTSTVWVTGMSDRQIVFNGNNDVYTFTYSGGTSAAITPALSGTSDITTGSYSIIDYDYSVGSAFVDGEMTKMYYWSSNHKTYLKRYDEYDWATKQSTSPGTPSQFRFYGEDSNGYEEFYITPPDDTGRTVYVEYEKRLDSMTEYTGTCTVTNAKTVVTGSSTSFTTNVVAGDYLRMDGSGTGANSKWYKIASVTSDTVLVLDGNWGESSVSTAAAFSISKTPDIPYYLHDGLIWGACLISMLDQGDAEAADRFRILYMNSLALAMRRDGRMRLNKRMRTIYEISPRSKR